MTDTTPSSELPEEQLHEELTAYLDGELSYEEQLAIEARINSDPRVRRELERLRRTWELLEYLPRQEPSANFTHRTISQLDLVALSQSAPVATRPQRLRTAIAAVVLWTLAAIVGYGLIAAIDYQFDVFHTRPDLEEQLQSDRSIAEHLRVYRHIDNLDFARQLDRPELFGDETID